MLDVKSIVKIQPLFVKIGVYQWNRKGKITHLRIELTADEYNIQRGFAFRQSQAYQILSIKNCVGVNKKRAIADKEKSAVALKLF